jgi:hypothetical protein
MLKAVVGVSSRTKLRYYSQAKYSSPIVSDVG